MAIQDNPSGTIVTSSNVQDLYTCIICRGQQLRGHTLHVAFCDKCIKELKELIELKQGLK